MAKKNSNLDNLFRDKLSGYVAPEKKGNWQLLNHLLDARERKRKIIRRILLVSFFLDIVFLSFLVFIPGNKKSMDGTGNNKNYRPVVTAPVSVGGSADNKNKTPGSNVNQSYNNKDAADVRNNIKEADQSNNTNVPDKDKSAVVVQSEKNNKTKATGKEKTNTPGTAVSKNKTQLSIAKVGIDSSKKEDANSHSGDDRLGEERKNSEANNVPPAGDKDSALTTTPAIAQITFKDSSASDTLATKTASKDSLNNPVKDTVKLKDKNAGHFNFDLFAGINLYRTQSLSRTDERSVSPLAGIELIHPLSQHFTIGMGASYSLQGGYHLADTSTQVSYFLDKNVSQQIILIRKQHKLYIPLTLYYVISDKHAVSCGIQWSYLVNTVGDYTEINEKSGNTTQSKENNVKGYMDGIKASAFSLSAGYRFSLSKRFDINTRIIQELSDSYTPEYFNGITNAPAWSLQTFVSMKF